MILKNNKKKGNMFSLFETNTLLEWVSGPRGPARVGFMVLIVD